MPRDMEQLHLSVTSLVDLHNTMHSTDGRAVTPDVVELAKKFLNTFNQHTAAHIPIPQVFVGEQPENINSITLAWFLDYRYPVLTIVVCPNQYLSYEAVLIHDEGRSMFVKTHAGGVFFHDNWYSLFDIVLGLAVQITPAPLPVVDLDTDEVPNDKT